MTNFFEWWSSLSSSPEQHIGEEAGAEGGREHSRDVVIETVALSVRVHKVLNRVNILPTLRKKNTRFEKKID